MYKSILVLALLAVLASPALAGDVICDHFEDGTTDNWYDAGPDGCICCDYDAQMPGDYNRSSFACDETAFASSPVVIPDCSYTVTKVLWLGSTLDDLPANQFDGIRDMMEEIRLNGTGLKTISNLTFADMPSLRVLHIKGHELTELPPGIFDGLYNLEELSLQDGLLRTLDPNVFNDTTNLEYLSLANNNLTLLDDHTHILDRLMYLDALKINGPDMTIGCNLYHSIYSDELKVFEHNWGCVESDICSCAPLNLGTLEGLGLETDWGTLQ